MEWIKKRSLSEATRMLQTLCRNKNKREKKPEPRGMANGKIIDHRYPALKQNHISSSRKRQNRRPQAFFNDHSQRPVARDWHCSGLDMSSTKQIGQPERCCQSSWGRVKGTDRNGRIRGEDYDDLTRYWGTVARMGQRVTEALGRQTRAGSRSIPLGGRR